MSHTSKRLMSLFDSLGPIMTGPSSSHTAGIARIGRMGRQLLGGTPDAIELRFYGALARTYKGHLSDAAVVGGLIGLREDSPELGDSLRLAAEQGIPVSYVLDAGSSVNPNTVDMRLTRGGRPLKVVGITTGGGEILMSELGDFPIRLYGNEDALLFVTTRPIDQHKAASLLGEELLGFETVTSGGRTLCVCALAHPPTENLAAKVAGLSEAVYLVSSIYDYKLNDPAPLFSSFGELLALCEERGASIPEMALAYEERRSGLDREDILRRVQNIWDVMVRSIERGIQGHNDLVAGFTPGDDAAKLMRLVQMERNVSGPIVGTAVARALAVMETNGCMGCVAAAPTAGACGVMPGALLTVAEARRSDQREVQEALLAGAVTGVLIGTRAPVSGALGGCQSEIGVASAMTAAALTHLGGGASRQIVHAGALALKNILGLVCDPVAGPVEVPCIKRNAIGAANAFAAADIALAGIESAIPPDEVIDALLNVQQLLPPDLRGTLRGGLASTATARRLHRVWQDKLAGQAQSC